jgi:hypothetical protein
MQKGWLGLARQDCSIASPHCSFVFLAAERMPAKGGEEFGGNMHWVQVTTFLIEPHMTTKSESKIHCRGMQIVIVFFIVPLPRRTNEGPQKSTVHSWGWTRHGNWACFGWGLGMLMARRTLQIVCHHPKPHRIIYTRLWHENLPGLRLFLLSSLGRILMLRDATEEPLPMAGRIACTCSAGGLWLVHTPSPRCRIGYRTAF